MELLVVLVLGEVDICLIVVSDECDGRLDVAVAVSVGCGSGLFVVVANVCGGGGSGWIVPFFLLYLLTYFILFYISDSPINRLSWSGGSVKCSDSDDDMFRLIVGFVAFVSAVVVFLAVAETASTQQHLLRS